MYLLCIPRIPVSHDIWDDVFAVLRFFSGCQPAAEKYCFLPFKIEDETEEAVSF
jgi:hypothetical protein